MLIFPDYTSRFNFEQPGPLNFLIHKMVAGRQRLWMRCVISTWALSQLFEIFYYLQRFRGGGIESIRGPIVRKKYRPGDVVPESGIYRVTHDSHRLMHEATLLQDQRFPICRKCRHDVRFELRRAVKNPTRITSGYHAILEDYPDVEPFIVN